MLSGTRPSALLGRTLRPVLAALLVGLTSLLGVALAASPAHACSCASAPFKKQLAAAELVVVATVEVPDEGEPSADVTREPAPTPTEGTGEARAVIVSRVYKGTVSNARMSVSGVDGPCGVWSGAPDQKLLLLITQGGTSACSGSRVADTAALEAVQAKLGVGKRVAPPAPAEVVRTPVEVDRPRDFARLAAPGAAAVLLGVLGLAVVSRVQRL